MARKWPDKNPESGNFSLLATPLSTNVPGPDPQPGINTSVQVDKANPSNPMGFSGMEGGRGKKKGRK